MFTTPCCEHHYLLRDVHYCATDITTQFLQCDNGVMVPIAMVEDSLERLSGGRVP